MSARMVDVTISRLLNVREVFARLQPHAVSKILQEDVRIASSKDGFQCRINALLNVHPRI